MIRFYFSALGALFVLVSIAQAVPAARPTHLIAIGGGTHPAAAMGRFVEWAGGNQARIVVVTWATQYESASYQSLETELKLLGVAQVASAPSPVTRWGGTQDLIQSWATGVFFSGGDQTRVMKVLQANPEVAESLRKRYHQGMVVGGTSAGTAILSKTMMTGDGAEDTIEWDPNLVAEGLGLLTDVILDQHFIKRQRENRLFNVLLHHPETLGLGVDEGGAVAITNNQIAEVLGPAKVMAVDSRTVKGRLTVELLMPGQRYDLVAHQVIPPNG